MSEAAVAVVFLWIFSLVSRIIVLLLFPVLVVVVVVAVVVAMWVVPKLTNLHNPVDVIRMFSGLTSRCMIGGFREV